MRVILWLIVVLVIAGLAYVRLAPGDPVRWNVDPLTAEVPDNDGWLIRPTQGNAVAAVYGCAPEILLDALDRIALATPRTRRLAGSVAEGQITYVSRSRIFGFPDYTTVSTLVAEGGATPTLYARQRFGKRDMGVNEARVTGWLDALSTVPECPKLP